MYTDRLKEIIANVEKDYNISRDGASAFTIKTLADNKTKSVYLGSNFALRIKCMKLVYRLTISNKLVDDYDSLHCVKYKENAIDRTIDIDYPHDTLDELYTYADIALRYTATNYMPSNLFGCCSKYIECSKAKKCLHDDLLYSKGCWYRLNIEKGKILFDE